MHSCLDGLIRQLDRARSFNGVNAELKIRVSSEFFGKILKEYSDNSTLFSMPIKKFDTLCGYEYEVVDSMSIDFRIKVA